MAALQSMENAGLAISVPPCYRASSLKSGAAVTCPWWCAGVSRGTPSSS